MLSEFFHRLFNKSILSSILLVISSIYGYSDSVNRTIPHHSTPICEITFTNCQKKIACLEMLAVIETCHPQYTNLEIINKCQQISNSDFIDDQALFAPITCTKKNITYWNIYCGICNFEKELYKFEYWIPWVSCKIQRNESLYSDSSNVSNSFVDPIDESEVFGGLKVYDESKSKFISIFNDSTYQCDVLRVLPTHLKSHVEGCPSSVHKEAGTIEFRKIIFSHFNVQNHSNQLEDQFCSAATDLEMDSFCDYRNQYGESCSKNVFLNQSDDSVCNSDGYFWSESSEGGGTWSECSNHTSKENTFYVCGPTEAQVYKKIKKTIFKIMDYVSTFLLFLYLVISTNKQNLRSLPKRVFYSYSISLWALYLCDFILKHVELCVTKYYLFFYVWLSHSFWILITSFDLWRIVYSSLKLKRICVEGQTIRFLGYCFLGWGLPAILLAGLFPTLEDVQKSWSCPFVTGFQNELICFSRCELNKHAYNLGWISIAIFLVFAPCLLVMTCVLVCLSKRNRARSNVNRTYTVVMLKVAIMMGFHWMLLIYSTLFDSGDKFSVVYEFISSFHGAFIFLAFGLKKSTLDIIRKSMLRGFTEKQTQCTSSTQNTREVRLSAR